jgi:uncharacterized protein (TIGR03067 family)
MASWNRACVTAIALLVVTIADARGADDPAIERAIDRGVAYLRKTQTPDGSWQYSSPAAGMTALAGLTLLECGVDGKDPAVQKAAKYLRDASINLTHTYSISLAILFFDRLGEPRDIPLIESLTIRLLAGQDATGGWTYDCPAVSASEVRRLQAVVTGRTPPSEAKHEGSEERRGVRNLAPEIQQQLAILERRVPEVGTRTPDNSNTQFAILALWVGRRQGLPVDRALARLEARFRKTQNPDGGWGYIPETSHETTPAMTCAGLLGLAVVYGAVNDAAVRNFPKADTPGEPPKPPPVRDPARDRAVRAGLLALGSFINQREIGSKLTRNFNQYRHYSLWSLERVAVAFGLQTIGNVDWYVWGTPYILATQKPDGDWRDSCGEADTCFALLFLRRSNVAHDLTARLRNKVRDPGEVRLKASGGSGEDVKDKETAASGQGSGVSKDASSSSSLTPGPSPLTPKADAARLSAPLIDAAPGQRDALIDQLRDGKGVVYTEALALAIPRLTGATKTKARDALAERLTRMTAATLHDKLQDENAEVRRAAALACAMKEAKQSTPDLIKLLEDPEALVSRAAHVALKTLTGQDLGPAADADPAERTKAVAHWREWWAKQPGTVARNERPPTDKAVDDREALAGTWMVSSLEIGGKVMPKGQLPVSVIKIERNGDKLSLDYLGLNTPATCDLNPVSNPKEIDMVAETGVVTRAIYSLEGDTLKICGTSDGTGRPKVFATRPGTRQTLLILKRHKP